MRSRIFITGISTEVGKTVVAAIVTEALEADYWKPIQAGDLDRCDSDKVRSYITNKKTVIHPNAHRLKTPMSPHAAAAIDGIKINAQKITRPKTNNTLVIEGAGGLLVPINDQETILDLIQHRDKIIVVSRHYLGSINHTLLTVSLLQQKGFEPLIIFVGDPHKTTESIIKKMSGATIIGRIDKASEINKTFVKKQAIKLQKTLKLL